MSSTQFLHGIQTVEYEGSAVPIQTAQSSIIGLVGTAGMGPVNTPQLIAGSLSDSVTTFGVYADDGFTIPQAMECIFNQIGAMVIVINVCDPDLMVTSVSDEALDFGLNLNAKTHFPYISAITLGTSWAALATSVLGPPTTITLPTGAVPTAVRSKDGVTLYTLTTDYTISSNVISFTPGGALAPANVTFGEQFLVAYTFTAVLNTDYIVDLESGTFTRILGAGILSQATGVVSYTYVDPTQVTDEQIIGGVAEDGSYTGLYALYSAQTLWAIIPRILIAPGWTHQKANPITANPVVSELLGVANALGSVIFADGPGTTDQAVVQYRGDWGSARIMVVEPFHNIPGPYGTGFEKDGVTPWLVPSSQNWAGLTAQTDNNIGFWASPSNKEFAGVIGLGRPIDYSMNDSSCRANYLNSQQVSVTLRNNGFRSWGNHNTSVDPAWTFLCVRRTADIIEASIMDAMMWAVDNVINANFFTVVVGSVNAYLRYLTALGALYGGTSWVNTALNTNTVISSGEVYIDYDFTPPYPAEHIVFNAHLVTDYVAQIFTGLAEQLTVAPNPASDGYGVQAG